MNGFLDIFVVKKQFLRIDFTVFKYFLIEYIKDGTNLPIRHKTIHYIDIICTDIYWIFLTNCCDVG